MNVCDRAHRLGQTDKRRSCRPGSVIPQQHPLRIILNEEPDRHVQDLHSLLTRWHKVAERLTKTYSEVAVELKEAFCNSRVTGYAGQEQIQRLRARAEQLEISYDLALELEQCIVAIRQALARANAEHGVATELARYDWLMRRQRLLQALLDGQPLDMVSIGDLSQSEIRASDTHEDAYGRRHAAQLDMRLMRPNFEDKLRGDLAGVQAEGYALSDAIAERNRASLAIELPDRIAWLAGL